MENDKVAAFISEAGSLKHTKRTGWRLLGIENQESVAEHSFRASIIAFMLAKMEGADAEHACALAAFHDMSETRLGDLDKVQQSYVDAKSAEKIVAKEQSNALGDGGWYLSMQEEIFSCSSKEAIIAKDADLLELAFTAIEYIEQGYPAQEWLENAGKGLKTASAKGVLSNVKSGGKPWWSGLKKL